MRNSKATDSPSIEPDTCERLFTLLDIKYPGKVWRVIEVCPVAVVKTIDNQNDALTTIANIERSLGIQFPIAAGGGSNGLEPKVSELAASMLKLASEEFGNHGCNDWNFPDNWTEEERQTFFDGYHAWNGDETPKEFRFMQDHAVMSYLAHLLTDPAQRTFENFKLCLANAKDRLNAANARIAELEAALQSNYFEQSGR